MTQAIIDIIKDRADAYCLEPAIVYGVCVTESGLDSNAVRYEPQYKWLYKPDGVKPVNCSLATEETLQRMSFGLMQVMGAVYREYGYRGWLSAIVSDVLAQVDYGCHHLATKVKKYGIDRGILSYNSGSPMLLRNGKYLNADYLAKVLDNSKKFETSIH